MASGGVMRSKGLMVPFRAHADAVSLVALLAVSVIIAAARSHTGLPLETWVLGVLYGAGIALQSIGVVLVYKANRIVNFAQVQLGAVGAALFVHLASHRTFLWGLRK